MMKFILFSILAILPIKVWGHGMLMDPINRASRWREDNSAPPDYDDNQLFCGGFSQQWDVNDGKCGLCGDDYSDPTPRVHEYDGEYGHIIVKTYQQGSVIPVQVRLTQNHKGHFTFRMCNFDKFQVESEECFDDILVMMPNGDDKHTVESHNGNHDFFLKLPDGVSCEHCILQWTYRAGNTWGPCGDGTSAQGCGPQEHFRTCSDIKIVA